MIVLSVTEKMKSFQFSRPARLIAVMNTDLSRYGITRVAQPFQPVPVHPMAVLSRTFGSSSTRLTLLQTVVLSQSPSLYLVQLFNTRGL